MIWMGIILKAVGILVGTIGLGTLIAGIYTLTLEGTNQRCRKV